MRLVFEGGGIRGIASAGVLDELSAQGLSIDGCAGSSAGAILAALWGIGYDPRVILEIMKEADFESFLDDRPGVVRDVYALWHSYGVYPGDTICDWLRGLIRRRHGRVFSGDVTIGQMRERTNREIRIVACNLRTRRAEVLGDDVAIIDAVRASMAIPAVFEPVRINGDLYVDGGCLANLPINVWGQLGNVVGVRLDNPDDVAVRKNPESLPQFLSAVFSMIYAGAQPDTTGVEGQIIPVDTMGVGALDFDISDEVKTALVESGRKSARKWLVKGGRS